MQLSFEKNKAFECAKEVAEIISNLPRKVPEQAPRAYIVGGFVRDAVLGHAPKDADVEVYGVPPQLLLSLLEEKFPSKVDLVGKSFGVIKLNIGANEEEVDISIPRRRSRTVGGTLEEGDPTIDPEQAGGLRDFTINSPAFDPLTDEVFNFCGGVDDARSRILRVANGREAIKVDPIPVYRGMQFIARMGLTADSETETFFRQLVGQKPLAELHPRRVADEFWKLFQKGVKPSLGLEFLRRLGITEDVLPELGAIHESDNSWINTLEQLDLIPLLIEEGDRSYLSRERVLASLGILWRELLQADPDHGIATAKSFWNRISFSKDFYTHALSLTLQQDNLVEFAREHSSRKAPEIEKAPEKKPPKRTAMRGPMGMIKAAPQSARASVISQERNTQARNLAAWFDEKSLGSLSLFYDAIGDSVAKQASLYLEKTVKEMVDDSSTPHIISRDDLTEKLKFQRGLELGYIIGKVESLRSELLTRERAMKYVDDNREALLVEAKEVLSQKNSD